MSSRMAALKNIADRWAVVTAGIMTCKQCGQNVPASLATQWKQLCVVYFKHLELCPQLAFWESGNVKIAARFRMTDEEMWNDIIEVFDAKNPTVDMFAELAPHLNRLYTKGSSLRLLCQSFSSWPSDLVKVKFSITT